MSDLGDMFEELQRCCLHDPQWLPTDVDAELRWIGNRKTGGDSSSIVIVRLKPQGNAPCEFGLLTQNEDYTGHGCMCGSMTVREPTLHKLLAHLDSIELSQVIEP